MKVDFSTRCGKIKPMHATNNGPSAHSLAKYKAGEVHPYSSNIDEFKKSGIPYARTHDSAFFFGYGMEHSVDVYYIFPNFDADPYDPENYDFVCTDTYLEACAMAGVEVFYRLGHRIEHEVRKYGTVAPKDPYKWAVICEHIIRHYTEGWANGYNYKIEYWEIWNEPDAHWNDGLPSPTWTGTPEQFFELYHVTATHLKKCFPHLKIGGPSIAGFFDWVELFLSQLKAPLDFLSYHCYPHNIRDIVSLNRRMRVMLDKYGFTDTECILNEWNYVLGWSGDKMVYSNEQRCKIKGAAFTLAVMCASQYSEADMLMYYDARPSQSWNGIFDHEVMGKPLKGYYPFPMFDTLYKLGECVSVTGNNDDEGYICAAKREDEAAIIVTHFNDDDSTEDKFFKVEISGFGTDEGTEIEFYLLDESHSCELVGRTIYYGDKFTSEIKLPNFTSYLLKLKKKMADIF